MRHSEPCTMKTWLAPLGSTLATDTQCGSHNPETCDALCHSTNQYDTVGQSQPQHQLCYQAIHACAQRAVSSCVLSGSSHAPLSLSQNGMNTGFDDIRRTLGKSSLLIMHKQSPRQSWACESKATHQKLTMSAKGQTLTNSKHSGLTQTESKPDILYIQGC